MLDRRSAINHLSLMRKVVSLTILTLGVVACSTPQADWRKVRNSEPRQVFEVTGDFESVLRCIKGSLANRIVVERVAEGVAEISTSTPAVTLTRVTHQIGERIEVAYYGPMSLLNGPMANHVTFGLQRCAEGP